MNRETTLKSTTFEIERKRFRLELRENRNGRFVKLTESTNRRRNIVIIPASGLGELGQALGAMAQF